MAQGKVYSGAARSAGDAAVDGLIRGVVAGLAMAAVLALAGLRSHLAPQVVLANFDPTGGNAATAGLLAHTATAAIYGLVFALLTAPFAGRLGHRMLVAGVIYGLALWLVSRALMASELGAPLRALPSAGWLLAHVVYGGILGWLMWARR